MSEAMKPNEWDYPPELMGSGKVCQHGGLVRKCEICYLRYDYAEAMRRFALAIKVVEEARVVEEADNLHPITSGVAHLALREALREYEEGMK